jgi:hypothetical protein
VNDRNAFIGGTALRAPTSGSLRKFSTELVTTIRALARLCHPISLPVGRRVITYYAYTLYSGSVAEASLTSKRPGKEDCVMISIVLYGSLIDLDRRLRYREVGAQPACRR